MLMRSFSKSTRNEYLKGGYYLLKTVWETHALFSQGKGKNSEYHVNITEQSERETEFMYEGYGRDRYRAK